jgi:hypothetical protein
MGMGEIGWSPRVFWSSTLPDLLAAYRGYQDKQKRADARAGEIVALMANINRDREKQPDAFTPDIWFPSLYKKPVIQVGDDGIPEISLESTLRPGETFREFGDDIPDEE